MAKVVMILQATIVLALMLGDKICAALGQPVPSVLAEMQKSPWMYGLGAFFLGS